MLHQYLMTVCQSRVRELLQERTPLAGQWIVEGDLLRSVLQAPCDVFQGNIGALRNFLGCWGPAMLYDKSVRNLADASHVVAAIFWKSQQRLRGVGTVHSLLDLPDSIGTELQLVSIVKIVDRSHQPDVVILN